MFIFNTVRLPFPLLLNLDYDFHPGTPRKEVQHLFIQPAKELGVSAINLFNTLISIGIISQEYDTVTCCALFEYKWASINCNCRSGPENKFPNELKPRSHFVRMAKETRSRIMVENPNWSKGMEGQIKWGGEGGKGSFTYLQTTNFSQLIASLLSKTT